MSRDHLRLLTQSAFFILIAALPAFDILRFDLTLGHAWFFGSPWHVESNPKSILLTLFLPIIGFALVFLAVAWKWGRLYCGWLCPHFSVVETINQLLIKAIGKHSIWDVQRVPPWDMNGSPRPPHPTYWLVLVPLSVFFAFSWALVGLTYIMPPAHVYPALIHGGFHFGEVVFLSAATTVLSLEFLLARHLFCRYACAVGLFQSLAWMGNKQAMVVGFDRKNAVDCASCFKGHGSACDMVCPMRLKPRNMKRWMFACTQCGQCISACEKNGMEKPLLKWVKDEQALQNEAGFSAVKHKECPK